MYAFLAQISTILLSYGAGESLSPIKCESYTCETAFDTNVHVKASVSYPLLPEIGHFAQYVNENLRKEAYALYDLFVQEMQVPEQELWEEDGDDRVLCYNLSLVRSTPTLLSFYGTRYEDHGGAHGSVKYITKTFWHYADDTIRELSLDDLFLPGYREWLFQYCENYFKSNRYGYYSDDDHSWIGFNPGHLDAFLLTEKGLLLIFQNYTVSGYEDAPMTVLIPFAELVSIANNGAMTVHQLLHLPSFSQ